MGKTFLGTRLGFKAWPCGAVVHPVLDAVNSVLSQRRIAAADVRSVRVFGTTRLKRMVEPKEVCNYPKSHVDTLFSLPWAIACLIADGKMTLAHFRSEALNDPRYAGLAAVVHTDMDAARRGVWVEIELNNGDVMKSGHILVPKGHPDNPQSTAELVEAYRDCVTNGPKALQRDDTERAKDMILALENVHDAGAIVRLLA